MSYSASKTRIFFGSATETVELTTKLTGSLTVTPAGDVSTERVLGQEVRIADVVTVGFTAAAAFFRGTEVEKALEISDGELVIVTGPTGNKGWAFPAVISADTADSPYASAALANLTFTQIPGAPAGYGDFKVSGSVAKPTAGNGIVKISPTSGITRPDAQQTASATNMVLAVSFITAEGVNR